MARVLIVDDEQSIRTSLGSFLELAGHQVSLASNAAEALSLVQEEPFDVVVTDIILPRKTGVVLLGEIREVHPDLPVILITGKPEVETAAAAVRSGAFDYLSKPVSRKSITRAVAAASMRKALLDKNRQLEEENRNHREHLEELVEKRTRDLQESEARLSVLFERAPDAYYLCDLKGTFANGNEAAEELTGYGREELAGKSFLKLKLLSPKQITRAAALLAKNALGKDTGPDEFILTRKDGSKVPVEIRTHPVKIQGKTLVLGLARNITEREQAEAKEKEHYKSIELLSETATRFVDFPADDDIYKYIGNQIRNLAGESIVVVNSIDDDGAILTTRAVLGMGEFSARALKLMGRSPEGMTFDARDEDLHYLSDGHLHDYDKGMYGVLLKTLSKPICVALEKLYDIGKIHTIGFVRGKRLFGTAVIVSSKGRTLRVPEIVEAFVQQASIALQRKQAEDSLMESEARFRSFMNHLPFSAYIKDADLKHIYGNTHALSFAPDGTMEGLAHLDLGEIFSRERAKEIEACDRHVMAHRTTMQMEDYCAETNGESRWIQDIKFPIVLPDNTVQVGGLTMDITERKQAEERTRRLLDQQVAINELSSALGEEQDLDSIYHTIYTHVSRMMETQALIISFYERETNLIRAGYVLHDGQELDTEDFPAIPLEEEGHGTQSRVIRTGKPLRFSDYDMARMETEPSTAYDVTISNGITQTVQAPGGEERSSPNKSVLYVPMKIEGTVIGVLQVQSLRMDAYDKDDEALLAGLANVAAIAVQNSRLNAKSLADADELRAAFRGTIGTLSLVVGTRDPYTAGHQIRVAELASAIATELRLSEETIELVQISAMVHDIGKLSVPAEILSKPSSLSKMEYLLIQAHVQTAYDILKEGDYPWPVADIVLQHHELLDGSGYPNGLKGDDILLEARIIGVADVVEAMSSHRPYRAALGIDAALEEIKSKKGTCYDSDIVDACVRLFAVGFGFSDEERHGA